MMVSIIIPAFNEEENIKNIVDNVEREIDFAHELVIVNDHSTDDTASIVRKLCEINPNILMVENDLDKGFANALKTGFIRSRGEIVIPVMADLCDDLGSIKEMLDKINSGFDVVCGCRYAGIGARIGGSKLKGFFSSFVGASMNFLIGIPTCDVANAFKMYRRKVIESMKIESRGFEISMEIPLKAFFMGFKITEVPTRWKERERGKSNFKMFRLIPGYSKLYIWAILKKLKA